MKDLNLKFFPSALLEPYCRQVNTRLETAFEALTERYYYEQHETYYNNIRALGM